MTLEKPACAAIALCSLLTVVMPAAARAAEPCLVPWPKTVTIGDGSMSVTPTTRIVTAAPSLAPLAKILAGEIHAVTGVQVTTADGAGGPGDIVLALDETLKGERYRFTVADPATVSGGTYGAVALGTVTLLQSLVTRDGTASLPRLTVADEPAAGFRGLMIDVARRYHSIENLEQIVRLCRLYKVRYLQLHLTDDQSFMFPSRAFPLLTTQNHNGGKAYTIEQLKGLVAYADARGVTIIPEYEVPGHSGAAIRTMRDLFVIAKTKPYEHHASINFCKDEVMRAVDTIVGEMCEVFTSSPYFHIGGDEADLALADQNADFKAAMAKHDLPNQHELYRRFVCQMNDIVKKRGKQTIVWEGFGKNGKVVIPKDIIVMNYEVRFYMPDQLAADGYQVINTSWTPLYVVNATTRPPEEIYAWNVRQFKPHGAKPDDKGVIVPSAENILGAQMCAWEQPESAEIPSLRNRLPAMMERIWSPEAGRTFDDFARRQAVTDKLLDRLLQAGK